jgi:biopolymer transport protein TolR
MPRPAAPLRDRGERFQTRSQINVTPLVDVCLVLLIIFMVVTPMLERSALVTPPATRRPQPLPETSRQLTIAIQRNGGVWVGTAPVAERDLAAALRQAQLRDPGTKVMIRGDRQLRYRTVLAAMRAARAAGFSGVGLVTRKLDLRGWPPATQGPSPVSPPA